MALKNKNIRLFMKLFKMFRAKNILHLFFKALLKISKKNLVGDQTTEYKIDEIFEKMDDNENEKITKDEFVNNCSRNVFLSDILVPKL